MGRTAFIEVWVDSAGDGRFHRKAANGKITDPSQGYQGRSPAAALAAAKRAALKRWPELEVRRIGADRG